MIGIHNRTRSPSRQVSGVYFYAQGFYLLFTQDLRGFLLTFQCAIVFIDTPCEEKVDYKNKKQKKLVAVSIARFVGERAQKSSGSVKVNVKSTVERVHARRRTVNAFLDGRRLDTPMQRRSIEQDENIGKASL